MFKLSDFRMHLGLAECSNIPIKSSGCPKLSESILPVFGVALPEAA